jgi:hypothetical protein
LCIAGGALYCFDQQGNQRWRSHPPGVNYTQIVTTEDLDGDGSAEILLQAGRSAEPFGAALLVSLDEGEVVWRYDVEPMSYAWYLYADEYFEIPGRKQIIVLMHAYPPDKDNGYITLFDFEGPGRPPLQKWRYDFHEYTCFPSLLRTDYDQDGVTEICIETHSRMWMLDPKSGTMEYFTGWDVSPGNMRSYGHIEFTDLNADGLEDFFCIATFSQHHEVLLNKGGEFEKAWHYGWGESVTTGKVVTTYPTPPYADVDGDGQFEIIVSMYNSEGKNEWSLRVYDALTGEIEYRAPGVVASALQDIDSDGASEIACNRSTDPTQTQLDGALLLQATEGSLETIWEDEAAQFSDANRRKMRPSEGFVFSREGKLLRLAKSGEKWTQEEYHPPSKQKPPFENIPAISANPPPMLLAANLLDGQECELILYRNPRIEVLELKSDGALEPILEYNSDAPPVFADLDGDGALEIITGAVSPNRTPVIEAKTPSKDNAVVWRSEFPSPDRTGLPRPRRLYIRTGHFTGKETPDLYVWAGTPLVRSTVLDGGSGAILWEKGEIPGNERYWGPDADYASVYDTNGDGAEDLVFTNPDYFCVADGPTGELLAGPSFPPNIFNQTSQGLYTIPTILERESQDPLVALVAGHYFQGVMTLREEPLWHKLPPPGENPTGAEAFFKNDEGEWLMGFGRQNGKFACLNVDEGTIRWELDVEATCSDTIACDVDGDGRCEFVFATSHGSLYAVGDGVTEPRVLWEKALGAGGGSPIAANLDGDARSEVTVPMYDGTILILDTQ